MKGMLPPMELRHLRYFVAVAEEENVTRAATRLHLSQPALSRQIRDLEDELGTMLLERTAKSVHLTEAGRIFLPEAKAVIQRADEAVKKVRAAAANVSGKLDVGYAPSLTVQILPQALRAFQAEFPKVRVILHDLSTEEMAEGLLSGKLQIALMARPRRNKTRGLHFDELARYPLALAVAPGHPLAGMKSVPWTKLKGESLIAYRREDYPEYHEELDSLFKLVGGKLDIAEEHDGVSSLIAGVEAGHGIAFVPACIACMAGPRLKVIPLVPASKPVVVEAARKEGAVSMLAEKFIAAALPATTKLKR